MTTDERAILMDLMRQLYRKYNYGARCWSLLHHSFVCLAVLLSTSSAVILKSGWLEVSTRTDLVATLSALAAMITALSAGFGFQRKWEANRLSRGRIQQMEVDLTDQNADATHIRKELKHIIGEQNVVVIGKGS